MSFSSKTKNELSRLICKEKCCYFAELIGIVYFAGMIKDHTSNIYLRINTENASVARRIFNLVKWSFGVHTTVGIKRNKSSKHMHSYSLYIKDKESLVKIFKTLGRKKNDKAIADRMDLRINHEWVQSPCCKKAFIRGAFLGGGSITDPEKTYHFEFVTRYRLLSEDFCEFLSAFELQAKIIVRKSNYVVYFKGSEYIVDLLNIMGAHKSLLQLENIRVMKEMRNNVNRIVNCETANLEKTVNASMRQIQNIAFIQNTLGIEKLPKNLQEIAKLRLEFKEATLKELGEMLIPPVGKSGVNHRLRKLQNIAEELKERSQNGINIT